MKKNNLLIIAVSILAIIAVLFITMNGDNKKRKYNWETTFSDGNIQPYDFGLLKSLLIKASNNKFEIIKKDLSKQLSSIQETDSFTYFFIGKYCFYTQNEINALLNFAESGHQIMLIAEQFPDTLLSVLQENGKPFKIEEMNLNRVSVSFNNKNLSDSTLSFRYRFFNKDMKQPINWNYISEDGQLEYYYGSTSSRYLRIGQVNDKLNFAQFKVGKGIVFLHTNPILFTNYFLMNESGFNHANNVFASADTKNILYDIAAREYKEDATRTIRKSDSPLSYILKQPAFKWAWYLLIIATLSFFLFKAKREQRVIAVVEQKRNTSLNFVETISGLYFNYHDHQKMTVIKMNLFTGFIRQKLGIPTNNLNAETIQQIAIKAKVPLHDTEIIFHYYEKLIQAKKQIEAKDLINLNTYIETFYKYYNAKK